MIKVVKLSNLDCANCANKIERKIGKIDGVNDIIINFISQKMELDIEESTLEDVLSKVREICKKENIEWS